MKRLLMVWLGLNVAVVCVQVLAGVAAWGLAHPMAGACTMAVALIVALAGIVSLWRQRRRRRTMVRVVRATSVDEAHHPASGVADFDTVDELMARWFALDEDDDDDWYEECDLPAHPNELQRRHHAPRLDDQTTRMEQHLRHIRRS